MAKTKGDILQGTLDLLILKTLGNGPMHGYGIASHIEHIRPIQKGPAAKDEK